MAIAKQSTKQVKIGRIFPISDEHHLNIRRMHDTLMACPQNQGLEAHYHLWQLLGSLCPEVKTSPYFILDFPDAFTVRLVEQLPA